MKNAYKDAAMNMGRMVGDNGIHGDMKSLRAAKKKAPGNEAKPEAPGPQEDLTHRDLAHQGRPKDPKNAPLGEGDDTSEQYEDESKLGHHSDSTETARDELIEKSGAGKHSPTARVAGPENGAAIPSHRPREDEDMGEKPVGAVGRMEGSFKSKPKRTVTLNGPASFGNKRR